MDRTVCFDDSLYRKNAITLELLYKLIALGGSDPAPIRQMVDADFAWRDARGGKCPADDQGCLEALYDARIKELSDELAKRTPQRGPAK